MPYNGTLTAEQFLFYEMRIVSKQYLENKSIEEIIEYIKRDNLFQYPTERMIIRIARACHKRIVALDNDKLKESFISAQKVSISSKKDEAYKVVKTFTTTIATSAGLNPFPMSDTLLIVPQQIAMSIRISKIFGFDSFGENAKALLQSQLLSLAGKQLVTSLSKFLPIVGQVINASVAGAMSYALGSALTEVYAKAYKDYLDTGKLPNWMELFSSDLFINIFSSKSEEYKNSKKD